MGIARCRLTRLEARAPSSFRLPAEGGSTKRVGCGNPPPLAYDQAQLLISPQALIRPNGCSDPGVRDHPTSTSSGHLLPQAREGDVLASEMQLHADLGARAEGATVGAVLRTGSAPAVSLLPFHFMPRLSGSAGVSRLGGGASARGPASGRAAGTAAGRACGMARLLRLRLGVRRRCCRRGGCVRRGQRTVERRLRSPRAQTQAARRCSSATTIIFARICRFPPPVRSPGHRDRMEKV